LRVRFARLRIEKKYARCCIALPRQLRGLVRQPAFLATVTELLHLLARILPRRALTRRNRLLSCDFAIAPSFVAANGRDVESVAALFSFTEFN
jgi:hypothetical protein